MNPKITTISEYIHQFPQSTQDILEDLCELVRRSVPDATQELSYGIIGFKLHNKPLIYFGGYIHHIGVYATPSGHSQFAEILSQYKQGKGSVQFPLDQPIPFDIIGQIIQWNAQHIVT